MIIVESQVAPYKAIWAAVMMQAIDEAWHKHDSVREPARQWIDDRSLEIGGFAWVCRLFDMDAEETAWRILQTRTVVSDLRERVRRQERYRNKLAMEDRL